MLGRWRAAQQNLVIQSSPIDREVLTVVLRTFGIDTDCPKTASQALRLVLERRFDMILTETRWSSICAIDLIEDIRRGDGPNAHTPIIVVTTNDCLETRRRAILAGADGYLVKPVVRAVLKHELLSAIARRSALM